MCDKIVKQINSKQQQGPYKDNVFLWGEAVGWDKYRANYSLIYYRTQENFKRERGTIND